MTDQEHAQAIQEAVERLNEALHNAECAGLRRDVRVVETPCLNGAVGVTVLVDVSRPL